MPRAATMFPLWLLAVLLFTTGGGGCSSDAGLTPDGGGGSGGGATAGASGGAGSGGDAMINCGGNDPIDPTAVIDNMEAPDYMTVRAGGRSGAWWAGGDPDSPGAAITPSGDAAAEMIPGGRCASKYAMHVTGHGFSVWAVLSVSMGWGAVDGGGEGLLPN